MATPYIIKRVLRTNVAQGLIGILVASYVRLVERTNKIDRPPIPIDEPYILAMWHGRLLMLPLFRNVKKPLIALISGHRDGRIISKGAAWFGIQTAVGSTSKGGVRAARELIRSAREGHSLFVTPDGPRGPRMHSSGGLVDLARLTGLPILPASVSARRGKLFDSWDRLFTPWFFGEVIIRWGEPIVMTAADDKAEVLARLDAALRDVQHEADRIAGRPLVLPA